MASVLHRAGLIIFTMVWMGVSLPSIASEAGDFPSFSVSTLVQGLQQPDGLAFHPTSGELYVSEESAARISVIRDGRAVPVIQGRIEVQAESTPATTSKTARLEFASTSLVSPEGIAFGPDQALYVVEDSPRGRVLQFSPDSAGHYTRARSLNLPELGENYAWESLCFDHAGGLYLAGSSYEGSRTWGYSCVLSRDATQGWWMVDYGPLASFSALAMSEDEPVLVAGDESVGGLTWWDVDLRRELQTQTHELGSIEGLCPLPDGSLAVALEHSSKGGRVVRVDTSSGALTVLAENLGTLESIVYDRQKGRLLVTEDSTGRILCLTPNHPIPVGHTLLKVARRSSEAQRGLPPRETPEFLRKFMRNVGVELVDQEPTSLLPPEPGPTTTMTLEELGRHIPLVAGRVTVDDMPEASDPITEVLFLSLFPNQISQIGGHTIPSLCLFAAKHRSGRVSHSESLGGITAGKFNGGQVFEKLPQDSLFMVPLATCSAVQNSNGVTVVLTFLGLNKFEDCFLTINYGRSNDAYFATSGEKLRVAKATFTERSATGQETLNFAMTGVRPRRVEEATWLRLNPRANWTLLSPGIDTWISRRTLAVMPDLVAKMRRYNHYIVDTLLADGPLPKAAPGMADQKKPEDEGNRPSLQQAEQAPLEKLTPIADLKISTPHDDENQTLTNIILSQIVRVWNKGWGE